MSRYPSLPAEVVTKVVAGAFRALSGPVRIFVPLLAEHDAREVLTELVRTGGGPPRRAASDGPPAVTVPHATSPSA